MPLCFECHAVVQHYNSDHPLGTKFRRRELVARRDQVYEEYTRHLVAPIRYEVTQYLREGKSRTLPDVGFVLPHEGDSLPVKVRITLTIKCSGRPLHARIGGYYSGRKLWRLNPRHFHSGHFRLPQAALPIGRRKLEVEVEASVSDCYEREHKLLPVGWVYMPRPNSWYFEP